MKKSLFILLLLLFATISYSYNVAIIYSNFGNGQFKNSLITELSIGGNKVTTYLNTDIDKLAKDIENYQVIVGTTLYNYENPVDFSPYKDAFYNFVNRGGVFILTDVDYEEHSKVISDIFPGYSYKGLGRNASGEDAIILFEDHPILKGFSGSKLGWAYGEVEGNWIPLIVDDQKRINTAYAQIGKGLLIASNSYESYGFPTSLFVSNCLEYIKSGQNWKINPNFNLNNILEINPPKEVYYGKNIFNISKISGDFDINNGKLSIIDVTTGKSYTSDTNEIEVDFNVLGAHYLKAVLYENNSVLAYSQLLKVKVLETVNIRYEYPNYRDIVQSKDPSKVLSIKLFNNNSNYKNISYEWTLKSNDKTLKTISSNLVYNKETYIKYDLSNAPVGDYSYSLVLKSGKDILREINKTFSVLPPSDYEVTFDKKRICYINGKPFMPIMLYHSGGIMVNNINKTKKPEAPELNIDNIVNGLVDKGFNVTHSCVQDWTELDKSTQKGLNFVGEVGACENKEQIKVFYENYKRLNTGLFYYTHDEPVGETLNIAKRQYKILREMDPYRPVAAAICYPSVFAEGTKAFDIMMPDPYVVMGTDRTPSFAKMMASINAAWEACDYNKPMWAVPQSFGRVKDNGFAIPTIDQVRCQAYFFLVNGATGFCWYAYCSGEPDPEQLYNAFVITEWDFWDYFKTLNKEIQDFFPIMYKGESVGPLKGDNDKVFSNLWTLNYKNYVIIVNPEPTEQSVTYNINKKVKPFFEGYKYDISKKGNKLTFNLKPYECVIITY